MSEKREKIQVDESQRRPSSLKNDDQVMSLCNEMVVARESLLTSQSAIMMESRDENDQLNGFWVLYLIMVDETMQYKLNFTKVYNFKQNSTPDLPVHEPSQAGFASFKRNLEFYEEIIDKEISIRFEVAFETYFIDILGQFIGQKSMNIAGQVSNSTGPRALTTRDSPFSPNRRHPRQLHASI